MLKSDRERLEYAYARMRDVLGFTEGEGGDTELLLYPDHETIEYRNGTHGSLFINPICGVIVESLKEPREESAMAMSPDTCLINAATDGLMATWRWISRATSVIGPCPSMLLR